MVPARIALARNFTAAGEAKSALEVLDQAPAAQKKMLGVIVERNWALLATGNAKGWGDADQTRRALEFQAGA